MILDVRLGAEYRHGHQEHSRNIPIGCLRSKLEDLDHKKIYLITADGGRRSELAAYILRQSGFDAYMLKSAVASVA